VSSADGGATGGSWTAVQRPNNGPRNGSSTSIIVVVVVVHGPSLFRRFFVVRAVPDVDQLVAARIFAVVQLPVPTCPCPAARGDHDADDENDKGTQHRAAEQRRQYSRVEL